MINIRKIAAAAVSVSLASTLFGCTPSIGSGSTTALTIDGYEVPSGVFIYYTLQGYNEASKVLQQQNGTAPSVKDLRNANIDYVDSTDWIQDKATEYCIKYAAILKEFENIGGELSPEDLDDAAASAEYIMASDPGLESNGISLDSLTKIAENTYREKILFDYYYGFEGSDGCSEEELKDYFDENFARIKYISISLLDDEGEKLSEDEIRKRRKMAQDYADEINDKSGNKAKFQEMDSAIDDYYDYLAAQTTSADDTPTTTTTTTAAPNIATTTTTADPYINERLMQRETTTEAAEEGSDTETEAAEPTENEKNQTKFNNFIFNDLKPYKAEVYDFSDETIYVIIRGDLRERMTEDDYWSEDYISNLQSMKFYDSFVEKMDAKADALSYEKNKSAYRRYAPFKLDYYKV